MGLGTEKHLKLCSKPCLSATASSTFIGSLVAMTMGGSLRGYRSKKNNNQHHLTLQIKLEANKSWQVPLALPRQKFLLFLAHVVALFYVAVVLSGLLPPLRHFRFSAFSAYKSPFLFSFVDCLKGNSLFSV